MTDERANFRRSELSKRGKLGDAACVWSKGSSGPLPFALWVQQLPQQPRRSQRPRNALHFLHSGVFGPPPLFVRCSPRWFESTPSGGSLGLDLFGLPAQEFESAPFFAWSVLASPPLCTFHHCTGAGGHRPTVPEGR